MSFPFLRKNTLTIELKKLPVYGDFTYSFRYPIRDDVCNAILSSPEIPEHCLVPFKNCVINKLVDGEVRINYVPAAYYQISDKKSVGIGRLYAENEGALGCHSRFIKNTIFKLEGWTDFDMVKGHASIIAEIARLNRMSYSNIRHYIDNFDTIASSLCEFYSHPDSPPIQPEDIKYLFNLTIYGGGMKTWLANIYEGNKKWKTPPRKLKTEGEHPQYSSFKMEIQSIMDVVWRDNEELRDIVCDKSEEEYKQKSTLMSYWCGVFENHILHIAYKYAMDASIITRRHCVDLCYDGFTAKCKADTDFVFHIAKMNEKIQKRTGLNVTFKVKPFDGVIDSVIERVKSLREINGDDIDGMICHGMAETDKRAADIIYNAIRHRVIFCDGMFYFKEHNCWTFCDGKNATHMSKLRNIIQHHTNILDNNGAPFSQTTKGAGSILTALILLFEAKPDNTLTRKFRTTTIGKLCFKDGVLNLAENRFYKWSEIPPDTYYSPIQIDRPFADYFKNPDEAVIREIQQKLFIDTLGEKQGNLFLKFLARRAGGHYVDKHWAQWIGNRNSGKGVIYEIMKNALGGYVEPFELNNLIVSKHGVRGEVPEKAMAFALPLQHARIAVAQEAQPSSGETRLNGMVIKKLMSGGDTCIAKLNYSVYMIQFICAASILLFVNDVPPPTVADIYETCLNLSSSITFTTQKDIDEQVASGVPDVITRNYRVGDDNIKDKCDTDEYANAFIMLLLRNYSKEKIDLKSLKREMSGDDDTQLTILEFVYKTYQYTGDEKDRLAINDIRREYKEVTGADISSQKIVGQFKDAFPVKKTNKGLCVCGFKPKAEVQDEEISDEHVAASP